MSEMQYLELHGDRVAYQDVGSGRSVAADPWHGREVPKHGGR